MALHIENPELERLAAEVAAPSGVSEVEAIRRALEDRKANLSPRRKRTEGLEEWLSTEIWPYVKPEFRGKSVTKEEYDALNDE